MMNKQQLTHLQQQAKLITGKARLITDEIKLITNARPMVQVAERDLLALQTQVARLRAALAALDKIEVLVAEGYYATDDETAWLKHANTIIAVINDARYN